MAESAPGKALTRLKASILYLMWRRRRNGDGRLSSAKELLSQLTSGQFAGEFAGFVGLDIKKIQKSLRGLEEAGLVESGSGWKEDERQPGPPPTGYRLPEAGKLINWESTAKLLTSLFNNPHRPVHEDRFVSEMLQLGLCQDDSGKPSSRAEILGQIEYCKGKGYITAEVVANNPSGGTGATLQCTSAVDEYWLFIEMLAKQKRPAGSEMITPSKASAGDSGGGESHT